MVGEYQAFSKIARLQRGCVITEKIDGTNGQVYIAPNDTSEELPLEAFQVGDVWVAAGSRNRWLTEQEDNYAFFKWVHSNAAQLVAELGPGRHYGEWWGVGIGRAYNLFERRFSLFNTSRWKDVELKLCKVVPILYEGGFCTQAASQSLKALEANGSYAAPGFMRPEGIVVFHKAANVLFKQTIEKDEEPKGKANG